MSLDLGNEENAPPLLNIAPLIRQLYSQLNSENTQLLGSSALYNTLLEFSGSASFGDVSAAQASTSDLTRQPHAPPPHTFSSHPQALPPSCLSQATPDRVDFDVYCTRELTVHKLYAFEAEDAYLDYPETHPVGIAYLFRQSDDPSKWRDPIANFAYSAGAPSGLTEKGDHRTVAPLRSSKTKERVACTSVHKTCQGVKVCPKADEDEMKRPHRVASRELLAQRIRQDLETNREILSTSLAVFNNTYQYLIALQRVGCRAEGVVVDANPTDLQLHVEMLKRGYEDQVRRCSGAMRCIREENKTFVQCEHYDSEDRRDHYRLPLDDSLDAEYIWAHLEGEPHEAKEFEDAAERLGYLVPNSRCTHVVNASSFAHRNEEGILYQPLMKKLPCTVKFRRFDPLPEFRQECPYTLVIVRGEHEHPIPLPTRTPPQIRAKLFDLFYSMEEDLADLTVRRFLRAPTTRSFLNSVFPSSPHATLSDVHPSLANRSHVRSYIKAAKDKIYPQGTGWEGALELLRAAQENSDAESTYIRTVVDEDDSDFPEHTEDTHHAPTDRSSRLRMLICMTPEASNRLLDAQYLQCDISFKRVVDFHEFILVGMEPHSNTGKYPILPLVYLNRETAEAHRRLFNELDKIVQLDTGFPIPWRHIYADSIEERDGFVLLLTLDQHGIGMYFQDVCRLLERFDLHEPERRLSELSPYEHLHRLVCICTVHFNRNISEAKGLSHEVKTLMRSLSCLDHVDWDGTIQAIKDKGGRKGIDWINNKVYSYFAFEGLCQMKSKIPRDIWRAGVRNTNLVESCHFQAYGEGKKCTVVGAIRKGQRYDAMRMGTLRTFEAAGIHPSYKAGTRYDNAVNAIKRRGQVTARRNKVADVHIGKHNVRIDQLLEKIEKIKTKGTNLYQQISQQRRMVPINEDLLQTLEGDYEKAKKAFKKVFEEVHSLNAEARKLAKGSGKVKAREIHIGDS
ncbi:hypothetical protein BDZ89DRAFT_1039926 [Hymenopellis radicata]|nr:hypothetical protein BDZ89DRAFT_1039926 [Hymenopellis radicata]